MGTKDNIPEGYMEDQAGRLVPIETIKPVDIMRDTLVREIAADAHKASEAITEFKEKAFGDIAAFVELSAEKYGAKIRGAAGKGNITLTSFDGRLKVQRAISDRITFDERLQAAKALIDGCITDWSKGSRPEIQALVNDAFDVDKEGNINTGRVLGLRRLNITDARWLQAMKAISDAVRIVDSKAYIRVYEKPEGSDEYRPIALDVASA